MIVWFYNGNDPEPFLPQKIDCIPRKGDFVTIEDKSGVVDEVSWNFISTGIWQVLITLKDFEGI